MNDRRHVIEAADLMDKVLGPELAEIVNAITQDPGPDNPYSIEIPDINVVDLAPEDLASLVARTSNTFSRMARFAGRARAKYKLAEGRYKRKLKTSMVGKNVAEREANAMNAASDEYNAMITIEAVVELAESMEIAARVASESARKLFDKVQSIQIAQAREERGYYRDRDFH